MAIRFRFTKKSLLVCILVCAIPLGLLAVPLWRYARYRAIVNQMDRPSPCIEWEWEYGKPVEFDAFDPEYNLGFTHEDFKRFGQLDTLRKITIMNAPTLSEEDFAALKPLRNLQVLRLNNTPFTNDALAQLGELKELRALDVAGTAFTDEGIPTLRKFPHLHGLDLTGTAVTDEGLNEVAKLTSLRDLRLGAPGNSLLSVEGIERFKAARPDVEVLLGPPHPSQTGRARRTPPQHYLEVTVLHTDNQYCPFHFVCKLPKERHPDLASVPGSLPLSTATILKNLDPPLPEHAMKYFLTHARLPAELANGVSPQLMKSLKQGVPVEIRMIRDDVGRSFTINTTLRIDERELADVAPKE